MKIPALFVVSVVLGIIVVVSVNIWQYSSLLTVFTTPLNKASSITIEGSVKRINGQRITVVNGKNAFTFNAPASTNALRFDRDISLSLRESTGSAALISYSQPQKITIRDLKPGEKITAFFRVNGANLEVVNVFIYPKQN